MVNYAVSNVSTTGKVFLMNQASLVFTDNGNTYTARIQTPKIDFGTSKRKFWHSVDVVGDVETSSSAFTLSCSDDDYQSYTVLRSDGDLSNLRTYFTRLGSSRRRSWVITHSAATPMRLEALELEVETGAQ
jgi:hypothetical protein